MKRIILFSLALAAMVFTSNVASAQFKYQSGRVLVGNVEPFSFYSITVGGNGIYFNHTSNRFFQIDVAAYGAPRLAGHNNQVVFYNTQTSTFNAIQVSKVMNYSDARAKTGIQTFSKGLNVIKRLRPVSYNFRESRAAAISNQYTGDNAEIGLLAQEVETVLPNLVFTDEEGHKLIDYIALIPVLIDAVQSLEQEIENLKSQK